mmetsp:Transcript_21087/g.26922  ORF Transcript_21087/g.26922 Transcript_21087/m.26922 type:complete len:418 (+) Transcript_21087:156-1409(+)
MWSCSPDSFFPWLYMESSQVAFHTRSRVKKRKIPLLSGIGKGRDGDLLRHKQAKEGLNTKKAKKKRVDLDQNRDFDKENSTMNISDKEDAKIDEAKFDKLSVAAPTTGANTKTKKTQKKEQESEETEEESTKVVILTKAQIAQSDNPTEECKKLELCLNSGTKSWIEQYEAVDSIRRLAIHHKDILAPHLPKIVPFLQNGVGSLRSAMCRNTLFAVAEVYHHLANRHASALRVGIDKTIEVVLAKSINDKRFIATAGIAAAEEIASSVASFKTLFSFLSHSNSKSAKMLTQTAKCSVICLKHMDPNAEIKESRLDDVIKAAANLESGRSVDARKPAQEILRIIFKSTDEDSFRIAMNKVLAPAECAHVNKLVKQGNSKTKTSSISRKASIRELMMQKRQEALKNSSKQNNMNSFIVS